MTTTGVQLDPFAPSVLADPYPVYRNLRDYAPFAWNESVQAWLVSRYEDVTSVLGDRRFSSGPSRFVELTPSLSAMLGPFGRAPNMLMSDPPEHTRLRRLVSKAFTPKAIAGLRPRIEDLVHQILDSLAGSRGPVDIVRELAEPLPGTVIAEMIGVPASKRSLFKPLSSDIVAGFIRPSVTSAELLKQALAGISEIASLLRAEIQARREEPREDLITALLAAEENGDALSEDEIVVSAMMLLVAGNETTTNAISNGLLALLQHPDQKQLLAGDRTLMPGAVEELLRFAGLSQSVRRVAIEDIDLRGQQVSAGQTVIALLAAANRDPNKFENPDTFDIRRDARDHLAFGDGIHFCLGAPLARATTGITISALLDRFPDMQLAHDPVEWGSGFIRGLKRLHLRW